MIIEYFYDILYSIIYQYYVNIINIMIIECKLITEIWNPFNRFNLEG